MLQTHSAEIPPSLPFQCLPAEGIREKLSDVSRLNLPSTIYYIQNQCINAALPAKPIPAALCGNGGSLSVTRTANAVALTGIWRLLKSVLTCSPSRLIYSVICGSARAMMSSLINKSQYLVLLLCGYLL